MNWRQLTIGDLGTIVTGKTPSKKEARYFDGDFPFLTPTDLSYDTWKTERCATTVTDLARDHLGSKFVPAGAVLFTCIASIGKIAIARRDSLTNQQINSVVPGDAFDSRFVYYLLKHQTPEIRQYATGVATPIINKGTFSKIPIRVPSLPVQRRIADILSAYDDLIENNNRRMALLEESIHLLYREWFVYLRFPGHERTKIVDGVPEGWVQTAGEHAIAFNPRTPIPKDKVRPYVPMGSISTNSMQIIDIDERVPKGGAKFRNGDTLLARITPCLENGKTGYVQFMATADEAASGSTEFIVMRGKTMPPSWVYCLARSPDFRQEAINRMSGSDGRQRVDWKALAKVEILVPSEAVAAEFDEVAKGVFDEIRLLSKYNQKLREARDLLLPRLLDGRIPV